MNSRLLKLFCLAFWSVSGAAMAQTSAPLAPADQSALDAARTIERTEQLWFAPVDWNERGASLASLVARVSTSLGEGAPHIEVRSATATKLTFALPKAPLGPTLVCLSRLANCQVWVLAKGLLIAPESALSNEERAAVKRKAGGAWNQSLIAVGSNYYGSTWSGFGQFDRTLFTIIGADLKAHLAAKGQTAPMQPPVPVGVQPATANPKETISAPFELPFGELSPATQRVLRDYWSAHVQNFSDKNHPAPPLSPEIVVGFDDTKPNSLRLFVRGAALSSFQREWNVNR